MPSPAPLPLVVRAEAPIRVCDLGGWTDTWFAGHGQVFNIAVHPCAEVEIAARSSARRTPRLLLNALDFGDSYEVTSREAPWGKHPLLEAALAILEPPEGMDLEIRVRSDAPPGAGTGTSAAVTVALLGALDALRGSRHTPLQIAALAQRVETEKLGRQCGIQDQIASAHGGVTFIDMPAYPEATVSRVMAPDHALRALEERLLLVYLGRSHDSSAIHETVIRGLEDAGPDSPAIAELRTLASTARDAFASGDFETLARTMRDSTEAQARLHPGLIGTEARRVISHAIDKGVPGFKVNGAGGEGGSLTLLTQKDPAARATLASELRALDPAFRIIPVRVHADGLRVSVEEVA